MTTFRGQGSHVYNSPGNLNDATQQWNRRTSVNALPDLVKALDDLLMMPVTCLTDDEVVENIRLRRAAQNALSKYRGAGK